MKSLVYIQLFCFVLSPQAATLQPMLIMDGDLSTNENQTLPESIYSGGINSSDTCLLPVLFDVYPGLASCSGTCDAIIEIDVISGTPPFTYWLEPDSCQPIMTVFVMDAVGCIDSTEVFIFSESNLEIYDLHIIPSTNGQNDGMVEVEADNGIPPYLYSIDGVNYQFSSVFANLAPGSYCITVLDGNGCSIKSDTFWIENITSICEPVGRFTLYPNPANSMLFLDGKASFHLDLLDADGAVVKSSPASASHSLDVADLPRGLYLVRMRNEIGFTFRKIVLQ